MFDRNNPKNNRLFNSEDTEYNAKRARALIEETIQETTAYFKSLEDIDEKGKERIDVLVKYGAHRFNEGNKTLKDWAGKRLYSELVGEKIINRIKAGKQI